MAIDPILAAGIDPPKFESQTNRLANMLKLRTAQNEFDQSQAETARTNKLRDYYTSADQASPDFAAGLDKIDPGSGAKFRADQATARAAQLGYDEKAFKLASDREMVYKQNLAALRDSPRLNKDMAVGAMQSLLNRGLITPQMFQSIVSDLPDDPQALRADIMAGLQTTFKPSEMITVFGAKPEKRGDGQFEFLRDENPNSPTFGQEIKGTRVQLQASPEAIMSNNRIISEGKLNRDVSLRGQDMADSRARESNQISKDNKPLTESQSKSALFGSRMAMANKIFDDLEKAGTTTSVPGLNTGYGIGRVVNTFVGGDQQQLMQAKRDFLNAVLRRESGAVITNSEFDNGEKQYFPQIGDSKKTLEQKRANREAATRGVLIDLPENRRQDILNEISGGQNSQPQGRGASASWGESKSSRQLPGGLELLEIVE